MPLDTLTVTITNPRIIDGFVQAAINNGTTPELLATGFLENQGLSYANLFHIGVITSAEFIRRFTPTEYAAILTACVPPEDATPEEIAQAAAINSLVDQLTASPNVALDDPRLAPGLQVLVDAGLIAEERVSELLYYQRPEV